MSLNSAEAKLRMLASADPTMIADFGSGPFRWFQIQAPQGYIAKGSCVRVRRTPRKESRRRSRYDYNSTCWIRGRIARATC